MVGIPSSRLLDNQNAIGRVVENVPFRGISPQTIGNKYPFRRQAESSIKLLRAIKYNVPAQMNPGNSASDEVVLIEFTRALNTFESIIALALDGYGPQGEMLLRPLFEATITLWWASNNPKIAYERYRLNRFYLLNLWAKARRDGGVRDIGEPPPLLDEELEKAVRWFGQYGQLSWTGVKFRDLVDEFVSFLDHKGDAFHLKNYVTYIHPFINWMLHSSGLGFWRFLPPAETNLPTATLGPSDIAVLDCMNLAWNISVIAASTFSDHFGLDLLTKIKPTIFETWAAFQDPEVIKKIGRNDPCPCTSGLKFKLCHGMLR